MSYYDCRVRYDSARNRLTAVVRRQFPAAEAVQYGRYNDPEDTILWKVLGPDETVLWDGGTGVHDIPAWDDLGKAVDELADAVREAIDHRRTMKWVERALDDAHADRYTDWDRTGIRAAAINVGDELTLPLVEHHDMRPNAYTAGVA